MKTWVPTSVRRVLTDRSAQVAGAALAAIFVIAIVFPFNDHTNNVNTHSLYGVLVLVVIGVVTSMYLGAVGRWPVLASAAFASAAMAAYMLANAIVYRFDIWGLGWPGSYSESSRLFGYNEADLIDRLVVFSEVAAPVGAFFGALAWPLGQLGSQRPPDLRGGWRALKAWHIGCIGLAAVFVISLLFPWNPVDGSLAYIPTFGVACVISAVVAVLVGSRSSNALRGGALFGVLAIAAYNLGCYIDYELAWRGDGWNTWNHQEVLLGSHAVLVAAGVAAMSPVVAAVGAMLAWAGASITRGRLKAHGQQTAG